MRFLVDNPVSPLVAVILRQADHDAVHVRDYELQTASDDEILARAAKEDRIVITADFDFGLLLARGKQSKPSVILFHHSFFHRPEQQGQALKDHLTELVTPLVQGSLIVFERHRLRIRSLPILH
jgi:predicted nuclease of predicted toxin-antitoxin system